MLVILIAYEAIRFREARERVRANPSMTLAEMRGTSGAGSMRTNPYYALDDQEVIRRLIRENPWGTLGTASSAGLVASHYPILLEEDREELSIVTHLGRPDEKVHELGEHEMLVIIQGPHGYISSSWYGEHVEVPTWRLHHRSSRRASRRSSRPMENFEVLHRLVRHFEEHGR